MRITRAGFDDDSFYGGNQTDFVHFRWLHKLLRAVPVVKMSNHPGAKFVDKANYESKSSKYGSATYQLKYETQDEGHQATNYTVNPFIDDQLDKHFNDVVKPLIDSLNNEISQLKRRVDELENK